MKKILILIAIITIATISASGEEYKSTTYKTTVDTDYGFYQVRNIDNPTSQVSYVNKVLEINVGDTVEWVNMADPDESITLDGFKIWDENTFSGIFYHKLRWNYQKYSYKFNESGKYRIHIDEYPKIVSQTIIVKELYILNPLLNNDNINLSVNEFYNVTIYEPRQVTSYSVPVNIIQQPKKSPGFELIFGIFILIFLSRKI